MEFPTGSGFLVLYISFRYCSQRKTCYEIDSVCLEGERLEIEHQGEYRLVLTEETSTLREAYGRIPP